GIRDGHVTGVQTCALPIFVAPDSAEIVRNVQVPLPDERARNRGCGHNRRDQQHDTSSPHEMRHPDEHSSSTCLRQLSYATTYTRSEERRVGKECRCGGAAG